MDATAAEALEALRASQDDADSMHFIFVTDERGKFIGVVRMALSARRALSPIAEIFEPKFVDVEAHVDQEEVAQLFAKYDIITLAVVDEHERLLGRIMVDDILEVWAHEADEDAFRMVGSDADECSTSATRFAWLYSSTVAAHQPRRQRRDRLDAVFVSRHPRRSYCADHFCPCDYGDGRERRRPERDDHDPQLRRRARSRAQHLAPPRSRESPVFLLVDLRGVLLGVGATVWHGSSMSVNRRHQPVPRHDRLSDHRQSQRQVCFDAWVSTRRSPPVRL